MTPEEKMEQAAERLTNAGFAYLTRHTLTDEQAAEIAAVNAEYEAARQAWLDSENHPSGWSISELV